MDNSSKSDRQQFLRYLLGPPAVFLIGYGAAHLLSTYVSEAGQQWLEPVTLGCIFALVFLAQSFPLPKSDPYHHFGPKSPNSRQLALLLAVTTAVYSIVAIELPLFWPKSGVRTAFPGWLINIAAVLAPIAVTFACYRRYRAYQEPPMEQIS